MKYLWWKQMDSGFHTLVSYGWRSHLNTMHELLLWATTTEFALQASFKERMTTPEPIYVCSRNGSVDHMLDVLVISTRSEFPNSSSYSLCLYFQQTLCPHYKHWSGERAESGQYPRFTDEQSRQAVTVGLYFLQPLPHFPWKAYLLFPSFNVALSLS